MVRPLLLSVVRSPNARAASSLGLLRHVCKSLSPNQKTRPLRSGRVFREASGCRSHSNTQARQLGGLADRKVGRAEPDQKPQPGHCAVGVLAVTACTPACSR